jgi:hypothetical protein
MWLDSAVVEFAPTRIVGLFGSLASRKCLFNEWKLEQDLPLVRSEIASLVSTRIRCAVPEKM